MRDGQERKVDYLRVSVTDRCNLRCVYCMPEQGICAQTHANILTFEEIKRLCVIFAAQGVRKIKLTGGEPLVRKDLPVLISVLRAIPGIEQITLTTNGVLLAESAAALRTAGVDAVNVSLDTLREDRFARITRRGTLEETLRGIAAARTQGMRVKLNCVPLAGWNEDDLLPLAALAREQVDAVRFIELMPMGQAVGYRPIPMEQVLARLEGAFGVLMPCTEKLGNGPAQYYAVSGFRGRIGVIAAVSHRFCEQCNRLRLTADGQLKLCLHQPPQLDLCRLLRGGADDALIAQAIAQAITNKPAQHHFYEQNTDTENRDMVSIGG